MGNGKVDERRKGGVPLQDVYKRQGVHRATIYNELKRGGEPYRAEIAQKLSLIHILAVVFDHTGDSGLEGASKIWDLVGGAAMKRGKNGKKKGTGWLPLLIMLASLLVFFGVMADGFCTAANLINILLQSSTMAVSYTHLSGD